MTNHHHQHHALQKQNIIKIKKTNKKNHKNTSHMLKKGIKLH